MDEEKAQKAFRILSNAIETLDQNVDELFRSHYYLNRKLEMISDEVKNIKIILDAKLTKK